MNTSEQDLEIVMRGDMERLSRQWAASFGLKYGRMEREIREVAETADLVLPKITDLLTEARENLQPNWRRLQAEAADLEDFKLFKFLGAVSNSLVQQLRTVNSHLSTIKLTYQRVKPLFDGQAEFSTLGLAEQSVEELLGAAEDELQSTVGGFNKLVGSVYLATRREYKSMRRKYLGETTEADKDDFEEHLMMQLFGIRRPQQQDEQGGPGRALIDNNCILTQLLEDLAAALPKKYERTVPVVKRKKITSEVKIVHTIDTGEVLEFADLLRAVSNPTILHYVMAPDSLLGKIWETLTDFYAVYQPVAVAIKELNSARAVNIAVSQEQDMFNPRAVERRYKNINFLAILPSAEDTIPRTRVERDYAAARTKLYLHLKETLFSLKDMEGREDLEDILNRIESTDSTYQYLMLRVEEAIELRAAAEEILRSDLQRKLNRDIQGDNEFYVARTGQVGALTLEREAAPRIKYEDVVGESFVTAKVHVEEVVRLAQHPHIMRLTAPRGDIRSNLLFIGPYGCGKTEVSKAICGDPRIIGVNVSVSDLLTAYMHESVKNIKRLYEAASDLRKSARYTKPIAIIVDEFDRLFNYGDGVNQAYDGPRMVGALQEQMDGVVGREGIFLVAMTNYPKAIPEAVLRRFKYVDVVGQLNEQETLSLFRKFLERGLPLDPAITEDQWTRWTRQMEDAPGDVIGKVADEVHFHFMHRYMKENEKGVAAVERTISKRLLDREATPKDFRTLRETLGRWQRVRFEDIDEAVNTVLHQPQVRMQINKAREVYRDAKDLLKSLERGIGFLSPVRSSSNTFDRT